MPSPRIPHVSGLFSRLHTLRSPLRNAFRQPSINRTYASKASKAGKQPVRIGVFIMWGQFALAMHLFLKYVYAVQRTEGISMIPTIPHSYRSSPHVLVSKLHRNGRNVQVGDVVVYQHPMVPNSQACKRIVGMPGDLVCMYTPAKEEEPKEGESEEFASVKEEMFRVPEGHCWLAGDNLEWSRDSRVIGAVPLNLITGRVSAVVWPLSARKWIDNGIKEPVREEGRKWVAMH